MLFELPGTNFYYGIGEYFTNSMLFNCHGNNVKEQHKLKYYSTMYNVKNIHRHFIMYELLKSLSSNTRLANDRHFFMIGP